MSLVKKVSKKVTDSDINPKTIKNLINMDRAKYDLCLELVKVGKKLWVKAPSAKILLKRLGSLKATKNISLYIFAPRIDAVSKSLINPKILDISMPKLLVNIERNI